MDLVHFYHRGISYSEYTDLFQKAVEEGSTSGPVQTEEYVFYTKLNWKRFHRLAQHTVLSEPPFSADTSRFSHLAALCITEFWCGDAAQNIPVIQQLVDRYFGFPIRYVFRDENLQLMDAYLTNGGRSIPKYVLFDLQTGEEKATWGPRPQNIQAVVNALKVAGMSKENMMEEVQKAYNTDKSVSVQQEWFALLHTFNQL
jgi:hypothetical protein